MTDLEQKVYDKIIETMDLDASELTGVDENSPIFEGDMEGAEASMNLDSIDALELGLALKNTFGVSISPESENVREHFYSVATLVRFIESQKK